MLTRLTDISLTALSVFIVLLAQPSHATVTISPPTVTPAAIIRGTHTHVNVSALVTTSGSLVDTVMLVKVTASGKLIRVLGALNDLGIKGDFIAGDSIFSSTFSFGDSDATGDENEREDDDGEIRVKSRFIYLRVSARLRKSPQPSLSQIFSLEIAPPNVPTQSKPLNIARIVQDPRSGAGLVCNELLIIFKDGTSLEAIDNLIVSIGGQISGRIPALGVYQIELPTCDLTSLDAARNALRSSALTKSVDPNFIRHPLGAFVPNDPRFVEQWSLAKINAPGAWSILPVQRGAAIGVIDTGVNYDQEDLTGQVLLGLDQCGSLDSQHNCLTDLDPRDESGHGTAVAGISAARTNNQIGIAGTAFRAVIVAEKVFPKNGDTADSMVALGIVDAVDRGARVVNLSLGATSDSAILKSGVEYALSRNRVVVASAGNSDTSQKFFPADFDGVISVGATDEQDNRSVWSSDLGGPCAGLQPGQASNYGSRVDIYAPGTNILVARYDDNTNYVLTCAGGTSYAAPFVSGTAAMMLSVNPNLTPVVIRQLLGATADVVGTDPEGNSIRRLNAFRALINAIAPPSFDFDLDFLSVAGNALPLFDDFNGNSATSPFDPNITCASPVSESGGFLHLTSADGADGSSPGFLIDNCALGLNSPAFRLNDGSGNSVITASFRADVPGPGQGAGLQLFTLGTNTNEIVNINFSTGPFVVAVAHPANGPQSVQAVPIDLTGVQRVMLRLTFNDATNQVTHSYSLNGGATFTDIPLPQPGQVMTTGSQAVVSLFGSVQLPPSP